jgi:hypothetical protein
VSAATNSQATRLPLQIVSAPHAGNSRGLLASSRISAFDSRYGLGVGVDLGAGQHARMTSVRRRVVTCQHDARASYLQNVTTGAAAWGAASALAQISALESVAGLEYLWV